MEDSSRAIRDPGRGIAQAGGRARTFRDEADRDQLPGIRERRRSAPQDPSRIGERLGTTVMADPVPSSLLSRLATRRQFLKAASTAALAPAVLTATGCGLFAKATPKAAPTRPAFVC